MEIVTKLHGINENARACKDPTCLLMYHIGIIISGVYRNICISADMYHATPMH